MLRTLFWLIVLAPVWVLLLNPVGLVVGVLLIVAFLAWQVHREHVIA